MSCTSPGGHTRALLPVDRAVGFVSPADPPGRTDGEMSQGGVLDRSSALLWPIADWPGEIGCWGSTTGMEGEGQSGYLNVGQTLN